MGLRSRRADGPWDVRTLQRDGSHLTITSIPGQHAPGPVRLLLPPVMGSVLELEPGPHGRPFRVDVTGDTLYRPWLRQVTERQGPLDVMVAHLGGTRALGLLVTMDARQGAGLMRLLRPAVTVPVHFDDYTVFRSPLADFLRVCAEENPALKLTSVPRGERADLGYRVPRRAPVLGRSQRSVQSGDWVGRGGMTRGPRRRSVCRVSLDPDDQPGDGSALPGPPAATQEAIDATANVYDGDATLDVEQHLRSELASRGIEPVEDAWVSGVAEQVRHGRAPVVGEHDGSVAPPKDADA